MEFNDIDAYSCSTVNAVWSAWQAAQKAAVPEGYVVVPKEPTKEQKFEVYCELDYYEGDELLVEIYKAMIEAQEQK